VLEQIIKRNNAGAEVLTADLAEIVNELIVRHSTRRNSSEVANAAWACLALRLKLQTAAARAISRCDDPVVALLALDCEKKGLTAEPLDKSAWALHMTQEGLYDKHWLLAYEANVKKWLPSREKRDHVDNDPNFAFLKRNKVSFYNSRREAATERAPRRVPLPTLPTAPRLVEFLGYD
jgi:hypothetical protein